LKEGLDLQILEKGVQMAVTDRFAKVVVHSEWAPQFYSKLIAIIAQAFGETLDRVETPLNWRRFVKRKDCPKYLKEIITHEVRAYYPKIKLPREKHYLTIDNVGSHNIEQEVE